LDPDTKQILHQMMSLTKELATAGLVWTCELCSPSCVFD